MEEKQIENGFESKKIIKLNKFFMNNVVIGLVFSLMIFAIATGGLVLILVVLDVEMSVRITIISMMATFILTTSKTLIERILEVIIYAIRLLGEEQRGFNKKIGVEIGEIEFEKISDLNTTE